MTDFYSFLGVAEYSSGGEIKKAYHHLCKIWHPDKNPGKFKKYNAKMIKINHAYLTLADSESKAEYDRKMKNGVHEIIKFDEEVESDVEDKEEELEIEVITIESSDDEDKTNNERMGKDSDEYENCEEEMEGNNEEDADNNDSVVE